MYPLLKKWINSILGRSSSTTVVREWRSDHSIYSFIAAHIAANGTLRKEANTLPDEQGGGDGIRLAPGLADAMFGSGGENNQALIIRLVEAIKKIATTGDSTSQWDFYQAVSTIKRPTTVIDSFITAICAEQIKIEPYCFAFAKDLAFNTGNRNSVKMGMAILGLCNNKQVIDGLKILGLHDEFTLYATIAISNILDDSVIELWDLAKKVDGWGRIQLVERLTAMKLTDEVRDWLVLDGYKNSIMLEYLAFPCAVEGRLDEKLEAEKIDLPLFNAAADILVALINAEASKGIMDYLSAVDAVKDFVRHAKQHANDVSAFVALITVKEFLERLHADMGKVEGSSWEENSISDCLIDINEIVGRGGWDVLVAEALTSEDNLVYGYAKQAAEVLGMDIWNSAWRRLPGRIHEVAAWYDVAHYAREEHVDNILEFVMKNRRLDFDETDRTDISIFDRGYEEYYYLDAIIPFLARCPGKGRGLILVGVKSPVVRYRISAIRSLAEWPRELWGEEIETQLAKQRNTEADKVAKRNIDHLLSGQPLDWTVNVK